MDVHRPGHLPPGPCNRAFPQLQPSPGLQPGSGRPFSGKKEISLSHGENNLSISFALLDFHDPENNTYRYRLQGHDNTWHHVRGKGTTVHYAGLRPGRYFFQAEGTNAMGIKGAQPVSLALDIAPAWWQTTAFRILAVITAGLILYGLVRLKTSHVLRRNKKLEQLVKERTRELEDQARKLDALSRRDPLTGLYNRRGFLKRFSHETVRQRRHKETMTVILADIDDFKKINDTLGHDAGDYVLETLAQFLGRQVREQDILGRWGGEEFIFLLPETDARGGTVLAERIRRNLAREKFIWKDEPVRPSMTFGLAPLLHGQSLDEAVANADKALYRGKTSGKNRVETLM
ncbi:MAG: GGDEF domain-containing protein [Desulfobacter sp.]|nr:MAG: GGDEF domain-containing protein [Desulfobacter sp.]